jgi:hypothetical protein
MSHRKVNQERYKKQRVNNKHPKTVVLNSSVQPSAFSFQQKTFKIKI